VTAFSVSVPSSRTFTEGDVEAVAIPLEATNVLGKIARHGINRGATDEAVLGAFGSTRVRLWRTTVASARYMVIKMAVEGFASKGIIRQSNPADKCVCNLCG
jgi:hypothetical protein